MSKLLRHRKHLPSNTLKKKHNVHDDSVVNPSARMRSEGYGT